MQQDSKNSDAPRARSYQSLPGAFNVVNRTRKIREENPPKEIQVEDMFSIPDIFTSYPPISDEPPTLTSVVQEKTVAECLPHLAATDGSQWSRAELNSHGIPNLQREAHAKFLRGCLGPFPARYAPIDASRPWFMYWAMAGLSMLGEDISEYRERLISTLSSCQNVDGGFGGGHGQMSHLAGSYASVLSLVMTRSVEAYDVIDRRAMWQWLGRLKQKDGGFAMCVNGEEDVRGAYCAAVLISLLDLPLELPPNSPARVIGNETFSTGLAKWISRCQTYEGGLGGSPGNEAHGAYTFCGLACLCILGEPAKVIPKYLNMESLISWLSSRQYAPEGGFAGRTNKLVDGCYSHWVGGCWALVEAAIAGSEARLQMSTNSSIWSREGLIRYILSCCQNKRGGLRDKPSQSPDSYHTCYNLAGLGAAQHKYIYTSGEPTHAPENVFSGPLDSAFGWALDEKNELPNDAHLVLEGIDRVQPMHPVYMVPLGAAEEAKRFFEGKAGF